MWKRPRRNETSFMDIPPPLLIIAPHAYDADLADLRWCEAASGKVRVNAAKFRNLEMVEVIVDSMPFLLTPLTADETGKTLNAGTCDPLTCDPLMCDLPLSGESAIGVTPRANVASAAPIPEVHRRLLLLGQWIGQSLDATAAVWMPARRLSSFAWFDNAVSDYLARGRLPLPFHVSCSEVSAGRLATNGLRYFTGQEIGLAVPSDYRPADIEGRVADIIAHIVAYGRIDRPSRSKDPVRRETLVYTPSADMERVEVLIRRDAR